MPTIVAPMRRGLCAAIGLSQLGLGLFLLADPRGFYDGLSGVAQTGPFNPHFVRDAGAGFSTAGIGLLWCAAQPRHWPAALAGGIFLLLHALIHLADGLAGRESPSFLLRDLPALFGPALIALVCAASLGRVAAALAGPSKRQGGIV